MSYALLKLRHNESELEPVTEVNVIPIIDISLVLLVILFVTAPLLSYPNLPVKLPKAQATESSDQTIAITYTNDGRLSLRSAETPWMTLEEGLKAELQKRPNLIVLLRVDKTVPYRIVARLIAAAKAAGAKQIALGTEPYQ
jgi:biopolymer transport protein ExbD